jgi:hypothetical protein
MDLGKYADPIWENTALQVRELSPFLHSYVREVHYVLCDQDILPGDWFVHVARSPVTTLEGEEVRVDAMYYRAVMFTKTSPEEMALKLADELRRMFERSRVEKKINVFVPYVLVLPRPTRLLGSNNKLAKEWTGRMVCTTQDGPEALQVLGTA